MGAIFVHIPKTAGTALRSAIVARVGVQAVHFDYGSQASSAWYYPNLSGVINRFMMAANNDIRITKLFMLIWHRKKDQCCVQMFMVIS
jgi:hypothetical protein